MKYPVTLLFLAVVVAAGCVQTQDESALQAKCAAGDQASCTEVARNQRARELHPVRPPIPSPATAVGGVGQ